MPMYMNMFWVEDGAHHKPSIGVADMTRAYSEANGILANRQAAAGEQRPKLIIPWASQPYTLKYKKDFGKPFRWRHEDQAKDNAFKNALKIDLGADNDGYITKATGVSALFINVFFVWDLQDDVHGDKTYGATLGFQTILIASSRYMGQALAHELGHALLGVSGMKHEDPDGFLMTRYVDGVGPKLTPAQQSTMTKEATRRMDRSETSGW